MFKKIKFNQKGFTVLELVIVSAIMALLLTAVIANFRGFEHRSTLDSEAEKIVSVIRQAQIWALSGQTVAGMRYSYGIDFRKCTSGACPYYLFRDAESTGDKQYGTGHTGVVLSDGRYYTPAGIYVFSLTPNISSKLDVFFSAPLGKIYFNGLDTSDTASIVLKSSRFSGQKTITINRVSGQIDIQ